VLVKFSENLFIDPEKVSAVDYSKDENKWNVFIRLDGWTYYVTSFDSKEEALNEIKRILKILSKYIEIEGFNDKGEE